MISISKDQLQYILERKYLGIKVGKDVLIADTTTDDQTRSRGCVSNKDAIIIQWNLNIPQPSGEMIDRLWKFLEPQFNSDMNQYESELFQYLHPKEFNLKRITINEEL